MIRLVGILVLGLLFNAAWAAGPPPPSDPLASLFAVYLADPTTYLKDAWALMQSSGVVPVAQSLGVVVLICAMVWAGYRILNGQSTGETLMLIVFRFLVAAALVFTGPQIANWSRESWAKSTEWGYETFAQPKIAEAIQKMNSLGSAVGKVGTMGAVVVSGGAALGAVGTGTGFAGTAAALGKSAGNSAMGALNMGRLMLTLAIPLFMVYYVVVIVSGFNVIIGSVLLPFVGALVLFPSGTGSEWMGRWIRAMLSALMIAAFMPLVFGIGLQIGFINPAQGYNVALDAASAKLAAGVDQFGSLSFWDSNFVGEFATAMSKIGGAVLDMAVNFVLALIMLLFGLIAATMVMQNAYRQIGEFIGSVISGSGSEKAGALMAGLVTSLGDGYNSQSKDKDKDGGPGEKGGTGGGGGTALLMPVAQSSPSGGPSYSSFAAPSGSPSSASYSSTANPKSSPQSPPQLTEGGGGRSASASNSTGGGSPSGGSTSARNGGSSPAPTTITVQARRVED